MRIFGTNPSPDLAVRYDYDGGPPTEVYPGDPLTYTLIVENAGDLRANNVVLADTIPRYTKFISEAGSNCSAIDRLVTCRRGDLAPGQEWERSITVEIKANALHGEEITNRAEVDSDEGDRNPLNNKRESRPTTVLRKVLLTLETTASTEVVAGSEPEDRNLTYTVEVANNGPRDASGVILEEKLTFPDGVTVVGYPGAISPLTIDWPIETLAKGETATLEIVLGVSSATAAEEVIRSVAKVTSLNEPYEGGFPDREVITTVVRKTDLSLLEKTDCPDPVDDNTDYCPDPVGTSTDYCCDPVDAGTNLIYTLTVSNDGPSDSTGATLCDTLPDEVEFVSSPDACQKADGTVLCEEGDVPSVTCVLGPLAAGEEVSFRLVALVASSATAEPITNHAKVRANEQDDDKGNDGNDETTSVRIAADLALTMSDSKDPLEIGEELTFTLAVTNGGPSDATGVEVTNTLSDGVSFQLGDSSPGCRFEGPNKVICEIETLEAGGSEPFEIVVLVEDPQGNFLLNEARVSAEQSDPDPRPVSNEAKEWTTIAQAGDADLAIIQTDRPDPVNAGQRLDYSLTVTNNGPALATGITVVDTLPEQGVTYLEALSSETCSQGEDPREISCEIRELDAGASTELEIAVRVHSEAELLINMAEVFPGEQGDPNDDQADPNFNNRTPPEQTTVLEPVALVVPYFVVEGSTDLDPMTTLFAVRNADDDGVEIRYRPFDSEGQTLQAPFAAPFELAGRATDTVILRLTDFFSDGAAGYIYIAGTAIDSDPSVLSGDYFWYDPATNLASGNLLLDTDAASSPPGLCRAWDLGFFNGGDFDAGTDFVFFVPNTPRNPDNPKDEEPLVVGRVYNPAGQFVQTKEILSSEFAFLRNSRTDLDLLARSGTVEWVFRDGVVGYVAGVFRAEERFSLAVPAFCKEPGAAAGQRPEPHLVLPYFELDRGDPGVTTYFSVRNGTERGVDVKYEYFDAAGQPFGEPEIEYLAAHAARTV
ncbi:MAG: DUF11 domain-containing protein, partial [bacterium]|nr:DUF11 domain-containing protein [bacterium]